jgi:hypothetical protein
VAPILHSNMPLRCTVAVDDGGGGGAEGEESKQPDVQRGPFLIPALPTSP